jgi:hypothetical protein
MVIILIIELVVQLPSPIFTEEAGTLISRLKRISIQNKLSPVAFRVHNGQHAVHCIVILAV